MNLLTKFKKFDSVKSEVIFQVLFLTEDLISDLKQLENQTVKIQLKGTKYKETSRNGTRRRWFQIISRILESKGISLTKENLQSFHETMKESLFDCETFVVDGKQVVVVPSINSVPDEKVKNAIEILIERYSRIDVDFSDILY